MTTGIASAAVAAAVRTDAQLVGEPLSALSFSGKGLASLSLPLVTDVPVSVPVPVPALAAVPSTVLAVVSTALLVTVLHSEYDAMVPDAARNASST